MDHNIHGRRVPNKTVSALPFFPWYGALVVLAALGFAVLAVALTRLHRWREPHHGYWGLILTGYALTMPPWPFGWAMALVGLWWLWDDAVAHYRQARDANFPRSGPRAVLDRKYSLVHRLAHRVGLI